MKKVQRKKDDDVEVFAEMLAEIFFTQVEEKTKNCEMEKHNQKE